MAQYIPFDHRPSNITNRDNASYTVPAGKYARVVFSYSCNAYYANGGDVGQSVGITNGNAVGEVDFWLDAGDVLSASKSNAAAGPSGAGKSLHASSSITVSINSSVCKRIVAFASAASGASSPNLKIEGSTNYTMYIEEYDIVSA